MSDSLAHSRCGLVLNIGIVIFGAIQPLMRRNGAAKHAYVQNMARV